MIQFQENARTDRRIDRPYFIGPYQLPPTVQQAQLAFKSQRLGVRFWSNQKLLHHNQHARNQLNL